MIMLHGLGLDPLATSTKPLIAPATLKTATTTTTTKTSTPTTPKTTTTTPLTLKPGTCSADGSLIWDAGKFWRRLRVGERCPTATKTITTTTVRTATGSTPAPTTPPTPSTPTPATSTPPASSTPTSPSTPASSSSTSTSTTIAPAAKSPSGNQVTTVIEPNATTPPMPIAPAKGRGGLLLLGILGVGVGAALAAALRKR